MKAIQQIKHPTLAYPKQPTRAQYTDANGDFDDDTFKMTKFAWKEDYRGTMTMNPMRGHSYTINAPPNSKTSVKAQAAMTMQSQATT